jgi:2-amino-4-hydroxy-6-hydroxymethyldihydropteridine diphosphokinase
MRNHHPISAYIAIGANLGDREGNIRTAVRKLGETSGVEVSRVSTFLENPAQGMPDDAPAFLNAAVQVQTTLGSHALLHRLLEIEKEMGRVRLGRWEPREIDLDLLLYGNQIISSQELIVPHPLMHERRFVLEPLSEIASEVVHPTLQMTIGGLLESLTSRRS